MPATRPDLCSRNQITVHLQTLIAATLYGPGDIRVAPVEPVAPPTGDEVTLRLSHVGICGSDLHMYQDGRIGDTELPEPVVIGHEFGGVIEAVGPSARDGVDQPLAKGTRVAVDPAIPCRVCEWCEKGHPNLCPHHRFIGVYPTGGALRTQMIVPARCCFPVPDAISDEEVPLLETLGVAIHAVDLGKINVGDTVLVVGAGAIGLSIAQMARLSGAARVYVSDPLGSRRDAAAGFGCVPLDAAEAGDPVATVIRETHGRGVDVALEAAWSSEQSIQQAADALRPGGRLVVVGISGDDRLLFQHSTARRKGLTIAMCRRMKHTYPRAIQLVRDGLVDVKSLVTHRFALREAAKAFEQANGYSEGTIKVVVDCA